MHEQNEMLVQDIVTTIRKFVRAVSYDAFRISREYGLTGPQSAVMRTLFKQGPLSSATLSRMLYVTPSNITGIIDRLEKKGFVKRVQTKEDRRVALIELTKSGYKQSSELSDPMEKKLIKALSDLEPEQVRTLSVTINRILSLIDAKGVGSKY
jgi:DNA-binding MarR family transcriptional regulator